MTPSDVVPAVLPLVYAGGCFLFALVGAALNSRGVDNRPPWWVTALLMLIAGCLLCAALGPSALDFATFVAGAFVGFMAALFIEMIMG